jgi:flagellar motor switch protein FliG
MPQSKKVALLLIALGQRWATAIMRTLPQKQIRQVSFWINQIDYVPQEVTEDVIKEFYERLVRKTSLSSMGGSEYLNDVLAGIMGETKAQDMIDELAETEDNEIFKILRRVDPKQLSAYLKQEQPQTIALMLSYLDPARAASILKEFPEELRVDIVFRLATLEDTDGELIAAMERSLTQSLGSVASGRRSKKVGGAKQVAEILNSIGNDVSQTIMDELEGQDVDLATSIKDLMFVFADVILLDDKSIQTLMKDVENADLVLALKGASESIKDKIYRNISKRQAEGIEDELSFMGPVKASAVVEAQQKIVNVIRKLDEEGQILIQGKGGDDIIS